MDNVVSQFLSKGTAIIAITVVILQFFIRRTVEIVWPTLKPVGKELDHKSMYTGKAALWWNQIGLYALPVVIGACIGWMTKEPYLFGDDIKTVSGRVFYAAVVGWFADFLYEVVQKSLYRTTGVALPNPGDSFPPKRGPSDPPKPEPEHGHAQP